MEQRVWGWGVVPYLVVYKGGREGRGNCRQRLCLHSQVFLILAFWGVEEIGRVFLVTAHLLTVVRWSEAPEANLTVLQVPQLNKEEGNRFLPSPCYTCLISLLHQCDGQEFFQSVHSAITSSPATSCLYIYQLISVSFDFLWHCSGKVRRGKKKNLEKMAVVWRVRNEVEKERGKRPWRLYLEELHWHCTLGEIRKWRKRIGGVLLSVKNGIDLCILPTAHTWADT